MAHGTSTAPDVSTLLTPAEGEPLLLVGDQLGDAHAEGVGDSPEGVEPGGLVGVLDQGHGLFVDAGALGEGLLCEADVVPGVAQTIADASPVGEQGGGMVVHPSTLA